MATVVKLAVINNCKQCPNCKTKLTKGFGHAVNFFCVAADNKTIAGYVEWYSETPQDNVFPDFCPLRSATIDKGDDGTEKLTMSRKKASKKRTRKRVVKHSEECVHHNATLDCHGYYCLGKPKCSWKKSKDRTF